MTDIPGQTDKAKYRVVPSDQSLAEQAYSDLSDIFEEYAYLAILEAGRYLIQEFYGNELSTGPIKQACKK